MRIVRQLEELGRVTRPVALAIGYFDGVHRGHQAVLAQAREQAERLDGEPWVLTFEPHPRQLVHPRAAPFLLTSTPHKMRILASLRIEGCVLLDFTPQLRARDPFDFLRDLIGAAPNVRHITVGENWRFGYRRQGSADLLRAHADALGVSVSVVPRVFVRGAPVSSTRIRHLLQQARLDEAAELLGRPYSLWGRVVRGDRRGHDLGFPTANLESQNEVRLPSGVYAARALLGSETLAAAAYIGGRPTFPGAPPTWAVEVHLLDRHLDLYGQEMELFFLQRVREDRRFESAEELRAQIARDVEQVRRIVAAIT